MLTRKEIQLELLQKLNELCEKANVKYALHSQAAFLAYKDEELKEMETFEVMMCQGDAERISNLLDDDDYYFEDFRTNPKFDKHYMMFGFKNSLDLKNTDLNFLTSRHITNNCIHIKILFIEHQVPLGHAKRLREEQNLWKMKNMDITSRELWRLKIKQKIIHIKDFLKGKENVNKKRYETKKRNYAIDTWENIQNYPRVRLNGKLLNADLFNEIVPKYLENVPSFILKDLDLFSKSYYGKNFQNVNWKTYRGFKSSLISWNEFSHDEQVKKSLEEIQKNNEKIYASNLKIKKNKEINKKLKKHVINSKRIINTRENYMKEKQDIINLYENGKNEELGEKLTPLIKTMEISVNLGYAFSIDDEIDDILDEYLRNNQQIKLANQIEKLKIDI